MNVSDLVPLVSKEMGYGTAISVTPGVGTGRGTLMFDPSDGTKGETTTDRIIRDCPDDKTTGLIVLDVTDEETAFGANPIAIPDGTPESYRIRTVDIVLPLLDRYFGITGRSKAIGRYMHALLHVMTYVPGATLCDATTFIESPKAQDMALSLVPDDDVRNELAIDLSCLDMNERKQLANRTRRLMTTDVLRHVFGQSKLTINIKRMLEDGTTVMFRIPSQRLEVSFCRDMLMSGGYELMFPSAVWSVGFVTETDEGDSVTAEANSMTVTIDAAISNKATVISRQAEEAGYVRPVTEIDREVQERTAMIERGDVNGLVSLYANGLTDWTDESVGIEE